MNYNLICTSIDASDELRAYVEKQLAHADKFINGDTTAHADVEAQYVEDGRSKQYRAEFTLSLGGRVYRAEAWGTTMHEALDLAGGELQTELRRSKEKRLHLLRRGAVRVKEYLRGWRNSV